MIEFFEQYLERVGDENPDAVDSIDICVSEFTKKYIHTFSYNGHDVGLLLGHVQSGKTGQMLGIASAAADDGFKLFIVLTTDNNRLQRQTINRAYSSLDGFNVCGESDDARFFQGGLRRPTLIVLKKNKNILESWYAHLSIVLNQNPVPMMIIDDEGDAASLNTRVNDGDTSTINGLLSAIKKLSSSCIYLQVTATPQANLLQTEVSGARPNFAHCFLPGSNYLGGDFFYGDESKAIVRIDAGENITLLNSPDVPAGLRKCLLVYILTAAYKLHFEGESSCNMLIHASLRIDDHATIAEKARRYICSVVSDIKSGSEEIIYALNDAHNQLMETKANLPELDACYLERIKITAEAIQIVLVNSVSQNAAELADGAGIYIGGNSLGRGVTFPKLNTVYYSRSVRVPQADTMWQHSRVFGYDRDPELCRIFMPSDLFHFYREFTEANQSIFDSIQKRGLEGITILSPPGSRPTRRNVVDSEELDLIVGGVNYFPSNCNSENLSELDELIGLQNEEKIVDVDFLIDILSLIKEDNDVSNSFAVEDYVRCLQILKDTMADCRCRVVIRVGRNISRGTGTLLSPDDRNLLASCPDEIVLALYRLEGHVEQGWAGEALWIPNIKYPSGKVFYATDWS